MSTSDLVEGFANTFGFRAPVCSGCRGFNTHKTGEPAPEMCKHCGVALVDAQSSPEPRTVMTAAERLPQARADLLAELGREPTLTEVGERAGVSASYVSQVYKSQGLDTKAGQRAKRASLRSVDRTAQAERRVKRAARRALVIEMARGGCAQLEIAEAVGLGVCRVSQICCAAGLRSHRKHRSFTAAEDALLCGSKSANELARELRRYPSAIRSRRRYLARRSGDSC